VSFRTSGELLMMRETVFFDTPDSRAMSLIVTVLLEAGAGAGGAAGFLRPGMVFARAGMERF
jgi:hypothetical protein